LEPLDSVGKEHLEEEKNYPTFIDNIFYEPKKDYCGIYITVNNEHDQSSNLEGLDKILMNNGVPYQLVVNRSTEASVSCYAVLDLTGKTDARETIEKDIRSLFGQKLVVFEYIHTNIPGVMCNTKSFPLMLEVVGSKIPVTAFTHPFWGYLFGALYDTFGAGGLSIIWMMGRESAEGMRPIKALPLNSQHKLNVALIQLQLLGWGKFEILSAQEKNFNIRVFDNFECLNTKELKGYQSSFMRGMLTGLATLLMDKRGNTVERKCIKNGDPYCEFCFG
jgi:predicted hydrocarbon binding protein